MKNKTIAVLLSVILIIPAFRITPEAALILPDDRIPDDVYLVRFVDDDGTPISEAVYNYNDTVTVPDDPEKPSDNVFDYTFSGWDKPVTAVTEDAVYTATYDAVYIEYKVTFKNYNGDILSEKTYHYGDSAEIPADPVREADGRYVYSFKKWQPSVSVVTGDAEYTAVYDKKYKDDDSAGVILPDVEIYDEVHTVRFEDEDGTLISEKLYNYGDTVTEPAAPSKPSDNVYSYAFSGWDKAVTAVTEDVTYTATYTASYIGYTVTFKNYNGGVLSEKTYHYGETVTEPEAPSKPSDNVYSYAFSGWDKTVTAVTENVTYTATFTETYIEYTVVFKNYNGGVLSEKTYHYGEVVTVPAAPSKPSDNVYSYAFSGWDKTVTAVTENVTYTATFTKTYIEYTIVFKNYNGGVLSEKTYHYGETVTEPEAPSKPSDNVYSYVFSGWDKPVAAVTGSEVYTALFDAVLIEYTVKFVDYDGTVIKETKYHYNDPVTAPDNPVREGDGQNTYTFAGWDKDITVCKGDETYTATYTTDVNIYTVTFRNYDGSLISVRPYNYGDPVTPPADPVRVSDNTYYYVFSGWNREVTAVTENVEYTAVFEEKEHEWAEPVYEWSADRLSVTASRVSKNDSAVSQTEKADVVVETTQADCENDGKKVYTAVFTNTAFETQTYEETVYATGHDMRFTGFSWEGAEASAEYKCERCGKTESVKAAVAIRTAEPSCETDGETVYTAVVEAENSPDGQAHTEEKKITVTSPGHTWTFTGFIWTETEDGYAADAGYKCGVCEKTEKVSASVSKKETPASCTEDGIITYTASVTEQAGLDGTSHSEKKTVKGETAKGHGYGAPEWIWNTAEHTAKAKFICSGCGDIKELDANVARTEKDGIITYTAAVTLDGKTYTDETGEYIGYTVRFIDFDGKTLSEKTYHYGESVTVPADPEREDDEKYTYRFSGWDKDITAVTENAVYTATYEKEEKAPAFISGDINGDGAADNKDVTALFRYLSGADGEVNEEALDVNGDGKVNNKDVTILFRYLSGAGV